MPKRKSEKEVRDYLANLDLELQSGYVNSKTKLKIRHDECGHIFFRDLNHIYKNPKCPTCHPPKTVRKTIEDVKRIVENKPGHKLLSKEYINNKSPIEIYCQIAKQTAITTIHAYARHVHGCGACRSIRLKDTWKPIHQKKLKEFKAAMAKEGYSLLAKQYRSNKQALEYICPEGHKGKISWNNWSFGHRCGDCDLGNRGGESNPRWKGGITERNLISYDAAVIQIGKVEQIRRDPEEPEILQVRCNFCGKWYQPSRQAYGMRIMALKADDSSENRLYCSDQCKLSCPVYRKRHINCEICGKDFVGMGGIKYCDDCTPTRKTFTHKQKESIFNRDLKFGWVNKNLKYHIHHILNVADFPEYAKKEWNGWAITSDYHGIIHNSCGLGKKDIYEVDERYFEVAINKLEENKAPNKIIGFIKRIYEDVANLKCDDD
jgi:hypothetical protein